AGPTCVRLCPPYGSIEPQLGDVLRIGRELAPLDALDDIRQHRVGAGRDADPLALARDQPVDELDLGAAALLHVLAHRGPLPGRGAPGILEALRIAGLHRRLVAFAGARDRLRRQVQDLLELVAERLADADRLAAHAGREMPDRIALEHVAAAEA